MESKPTASVTQDIQVPITSLYGLLMQWNKWIDWWPMYSTMTAFKLVKNPQTGKEERVILAGDKVPSTGDYYREFVTLDDKTYVEYLRAHDPSNPHTLQYDYISVQPGMPFIESITSKIVLQELEPNKTRVTWESWTKVAAGTDPAALAGVVQVQNKVYGKGIKFALQYLVVAAVWRDGFKILQERAMAMTKALLVGQTEPWAYFDLVKDRPFPRFVKGLPVKEALPPKKVGKMLGRFLEVGYLQAAEQVFDKTASLPAGTDLYKIAAQEVVDVYGTKDIQEISEYLFKHAAEDSEFCQQLLQGCNPLHIKLLSSVDQVPETMRHLKAQEKSIQELISAKRLFLVDYKELANLERSNVMYFKAPYLLVYKQIIDGKSQLQILAIQLERKPGATIYTPNGSHPLRYRLARLFVAVADNQVHEFRYHLGLSHLGIEPIIIATHNAFPDGNPIKDFLKPHFEETIGINFLATQTLIAPSGAFTNNTFAVGTAQGVELASDAWRDYDFYKFSFPEQLKARGFDEERTDGLENYHYRDDGFKLWHIIGTYAKDFVEAHYTSDDAVKNDTVLQGWAKEMNDKDKAAVPGFKPEIKDRKELAHILQIIVWNGSALHSLLNQPQWPYLGYVPNRPNGLYLDMPPEDGNDITPQYIQQALLPKFATAFQIAFSWLLTLPSETNLMNYSERESHKTQYGKKFHENLQHLTKKLKERNEELRKQGKNPYIFLMPENVACSVDI